MCPLTKQKVVEKGPWTIKGNYVILEEWDTNTPFEKVTFDQTTFWSQVHSLPPYYMNFGNAEVMGNMVGHSLCNDLSSNPLKKWNKFLRIKVVINVHNSLMCGFFQEIEKNDTTLKLSRQKFTMEWSGCEWWTISTQFQTIKTEIHKWRSLKWWSPNAKRQNNWRYNYWKIHLRMWVRRSTQRSCHF